jgi:hypothetical protein
MGNSIYRFLCGLCAPSSSEHGLHGAHPAVAALGRDVLSFQSTSQVSRASSIPRLRVWRCRGAVSVLLIWCLVVLCSAVLCCVFLGSGRAEPARRLLQESAGELVRNFSPLDFPCTGPTELSWLRGLLMSGAQKRTLS